MIIVNSLKKVYIHVNTEIMNESQYDDDSFIIVDLQSEADCYYKSAGKIELVDICDCVYCACKKAIQWFQVLA